MEQALRLGSRSSRVIAGVWLAATAVCVAGVIVLSATVSYDVWAGLVAGPVLVLLSLPALRRQAAREADLRLFWLLLAALVLKLLGSVARYYVAFGVYDGTADATTYHQSGVALGPLFRGGDIGEALDMALPGGTGEGTLFMKRLTGVLYAFIGPTKLGGFMVFSWLGFWGLFLFYRAFVLAVPEGRRRTYARLVFFLPSLLYWPSGIGKEAWMLLALGVGVFGIAKAMTGRTGRGFAVAGVGIGLASLVRPHVAAMLGMALVAGYVVRRPPGELRHLAPLVKGAVLASLLVVAVLLVGRTGDFLEKSGVDLDTGLTSALAQATERTAEGGSEFDPPDLRSPVGVPEAFLTVLFRPLIVEAHNLQAVIAAVEGTFLLALTLFRVPWLLTAARSMRRQPYVAGAIVYTAVFVLAFAAVANFGILTRERAQVLPLFIVLLSVPSAAWMSRRSRVLDDVPHAG